MARRVRLLRVLAGLSQRRVSARAGLDPSHIRLLEGSGQRTAATTIARVASALGVRSEYLVDGLLPAFVHAPGLDPARPEHAAKARTAILHIYEASEDPPREPAPTSRTKKLSRAKAAQPARRKPARSRSAKAPGPKKARAQADQAEVEQPQGETRAA